MLQLEKEFLQNDNLTIYTIKLDDGQYLVINEYEFEELKKQIKEI